MVNESNNPPKPLTENDQLGQRLAASNLALAEMQAEHRQLLEEMEQLRRRAEDLQRLREQQEREDQQREQEYQQTLAQNKANEIVESTDEIPATATNEQPAEDGVENEEEDPEEADYIKEKLAEIARLKAQFKRVQHMINTTENIEKHISKNEETETKEDITKTEKVPEPPKASVPAPIKNSVPEPAKSSVPEPVKTSVPEPAKTSVSEVPAKNTVPASAINETNISALLTSTPVEPITLPDMPSMADLNAASTQDEKEQLLHTMLSMFEGFSSDLKSQADNLRAERERIRELKESIIRSRQQPPK